MKRKFWILYPNIKSSQIPNICQNPRYFPSFWHFFVCVCYNLPKTKSKQIQTNPLNQGARNETQQT